MLLWSCQGLVNSLAKVSLNDKVLNKEDSELIVFLGVTSGYTQFSL